MGRMLDEFERMKGAFADAPSNGVLTPSNLAHLPICVQRYLQRTNAVGAPLTSTFSVDFGGEMKDKIDGPWLPIKARQFTNVGKRVRLFYIEAKMFGIPLRGLHVYINGTATMKIKLAGLITVADASGPIMDKSETVTFFNDMCLIAPETLIDPTITWTEIDDRTAEAMFTVNGNTITARLFFNEEGDLVNFISDGRSMSADGKTHVQARWSTPPHVWRGVLGSSFRSYGLCAFHRKPALMSASRALPGINSTCGI